MNELLIAWEQLRHQRGRSAMLVLTVALAFLVYGVLGALQHSLQGGPRDPAGTRLVVSHVAGLMENLPLAHATRVAALPGVQQVGHATWLGAWYRHEREMPLAFAVEPAAWLAQHPEMVLDEAARSRFLAQRDSMLVSQALAAKYGWAVGDVVPLGSILYPPPPGDAAWRFRIAGIFGSSDSRGGRNYIVGHYAYLNEQRPMWRDTVGTLMVTAQPGQDLQALAQQLDAGFLNSGTPTTTATDQAFQAEFLAQFGNVAAAIQAVIGVALFSLVMVISGTAALAVRQATRDIGVLKVLGFGPLRVLRLVLLQTAVPLLLGGLLGLALAALANQQLASRLPQFLPDLVLPLPVLLQGLVLMAALALLSTALPATLALRIRPAAAFQMEQA
jgi:putative ABC transport system permease protein